MTEYNNIIEANKGKTYLEILPKEFSKSKHGLINRTILLTINYVYDELNALKLYTSLHKVTKEDIVMYMMFGEESIFNDNPFIPRAAKYEDWNNICEHLSKQEIENLRESYFKEHDEEFEKYESTKRFSSMLKQGWKNYIDRQKIKNGELVNEWDMEKDGYPSTSRGAVCYLFIPVKGDFPLDETGDIELYNPRKKKKEIFTDLKYKKEDNIYSCINPDGKKVFLANYEYIEDSYSCLFDINKAIYTGWWNKTMEIK